MEMANSIGRNGSSEGETMLMGALMRLHPLEFSHLTGSLTADLRLQQRRLTILVLSTHHFSRTITYLHSLSLSQKTLLLARLLLRSLSILLQHHHHYQNHLCHLRLEEFDAALLLMTMCEVYDRNEPREGGQSFDWRTRIAQHLLDRALCPSELGAYLGSGVLSRYVDTAAKCRRLLEAVTGGSRGGRAGEDIIKSGKEVATSLTVVVSLPSVECQIEGWECVVCKEVIQVGRDVCVLPCEHGFHWGCILPWLRKRNTCPCCRFELPTDDVFCEIERVWRSAIKMGQLRSYCGDDDNV